MSIIQSMMYGNKLPIQFVTSVRGSSLAAGKTSVTIPTHTTGDFILICGASGSITAPSFSSTGWTQITTTSEQVISTIGYSMTCAYKIGSGASETVTFFGSQDWNSTFSPYSVFSGAMIFSNVKTIGSSNKSVAVAYNFSGITSGITVPSLTMTKTDGTSAVAVFSWLPYISSISNGMSINNGMAYKLGATSFPSGSLSTTNQVRNHCFSIELLN